MKFIQTNEPGEDPFAKQLEDFVVKARANEKFRREYLAMNLRDRDMMKKGAREKAVEDARSFLKEGDSPEKVSRCIGLPLDQVLELQKELAAAVTA